MPPPFWRCAELNWTLETWKTPKGIEPDDIQNAFAHTFQLTLAEFNPEIDLNDQLNKMNFSSFRRKTAIDKITEADLSIIVPTFFYDGRNIDREMQKAFLFQFNPIMSSLMGLHVNRLMKQGWEIVSAFDTQPACWVEIHKNLQLALPALRRLVVLKHLTTSDST